MKKINYSEFGEQLFSAQLKNGLRIYVQPKKDFYKTSAFLGVNFGSIDNTFELQGKKIHLPAGVAHFLEHKMFDKKDYDVFELFNKTGARSNAFTSFTQTNFLFSTTEYLKENIDILLNFVQQPYFTEAKVQREKGIIAQEIQMYQNDPNNRLYFETISAMYSGSALASDIAGTVEDVDSITLEDVKTAYSAFYRPENMALFVTGKVDPDQLINWVRVNEKNQHSIKPNSVKRVFNLDPPNPEKTSILAMDVSRPKVALGLRGSDFVPNGRLGIKYELAISIMLDMFFSENSISYEKLFQEEIIDDSFSWEFENERGFHFGIFTGDTSKPGEFIKRIKEILPTIPQQLKTMSKEFQLQKNELLGNYISMADSEEAISGEFDPFIEDPITIYDEIEILNSLSLKDVIESSKQFLDKASSQQVIIKS